jgi:micrococcal nuclease
MLKKYSIPILFVLVFGLIFVVFKFFPPPRSPGQGLNQTTGQTAKVVRAVDGDTIELENGDKVRYIGIDTPETVDPRKSIQCFGIEAKSYNENLVLNKTVRLEKDVSDKDSFGRLLRYVYVGDIFVNDKLVREGYARVSTFPPDVKFSDQFLAAEREAREANRGLWKSCPASPNSK